MSKLALFAYSIGGILGGFVASVMFFAAAFACGDGPLLPEPECADWLNGYYWVSSGIIMGVAVMFIADKLISCFENSTSDNS